LRVLVTDANVQEAQRMAGLFTELGYTGEIATTARQMVRRAIESPDMALVLFNTALPYADADSLLQELRHDYHASQMPVGFLTLGSDLERLTRLTAKYPATATFVRTRSPADLRLQVDRLLRASARDFVTLEERQQHARQALEWLTKLTARDDSFYDFRPYEQMLAAPLYVPALSPLAAEVLGNLGTPSAQRALVDVVSANTLPLEVRQAAARAFGRAVPRYGLRLTRPEIRRQYDRYNASENADAGTQAVLASILDTMEALRKQSAK